MSRLVTGCLKRRRWIGWLCSIHNDADVRVVNLGRAPELPISSGNILISHHRGTPPLVKIGQKSGRIQLDQKSPIQSDIRPTANQKIEPGEGICARGRREIPFSSVQSLYVVELKSSLRRRLARYTCETHAPSFCREFYCPPTLRLC